MLEASVSYSRCPGCTPRSCGQGLLSSGLVSWFRALDGANSVDFFSCVSASLCFHVHLKLALGEKVSVKFIPCWLERMDSEDEKDSSDCLVEPGVKFNSESEDKIDWLVPHLEWLVFPDTSCQGSVNNHL